MATAAHKSPAFQFYPRDFLSDENVIVMTLEERGIYITLLSICWIEGSIPASPERLARLCGLPASQTEAASRVVEGCFNQSPTDATRLVHPRLEAERVKQEEWREKSAAGGRKSAESRARKRRKAKPDSEMQEGKGGSTTVARVVQPNGNSSSSSSSASAIEVGSQSSKARETGEDEPPGEGDDEAVQAKAERDALEDTVSEIIRLANNAMTRNERIDQQRLDPILTGHGSRQDVFDWIAEGIPIDVIHETVETVALGYSPDDDNQQISSMKYFGRAVRKAERQRQAQLHGGGNGAGRGNGGRAKAAGGREAEGAGHIRPDRYDHLAIG